ncbi:uncharacterized protein N7459_002061 [Penicillium hispanicum]|uniref:uncharacterized protein n=1 Tax=Penicillium hispanicum TaxID=1080232 RepID=UPI0025408D77|nr:uncharacterized protein N7459_002061 [Penicillium hispanicum]KAJ5591692.1 hypothetical protein N7459_002061 [Penicillium hispanicum]
MAPLTVQPVTPDDVPALSQLWYTAFSIPVNLRMFPNTPGLRTWWDEANRRDLLHNSLRRYLKVVDPAAPGLMVAYAKWDLDPSASGERFPPWHGESDHEACEHLFTVLEEERKRFLAGRKHYYLDMLVTHPDYRGQGAASMLIQWGCDLADQNGVLVYLDAHEDAASLYQSFGFKGREDIGVTSEGAIPMIREPKKRV